MAIHWKHWKRFFELFTEDSAEGELFRLAKKKIEEDMDNQIIAEIKAHEEEQQRKRNKRKKKPRRMGRR